MLGIKNHERVRKGQVLAILVDGDAYSVEYIAEYALEPRHPFEIRLALLPLNDLADSIHFGV
jgi:hypothetical protein